MADPRDDMAQILTPPVAQFTEPEAADWARKAQVGAPVSVFTEETAQKYGHNDLLGMVQRYPEGFYVGTDLKLLHELQKNKPPEVEILDVPWAKDRKFIRKYNPLTS